MKFKLHRGIIKGSINNTINISSIDELKNTVKKALPSSIGVAIDDRQRADERVSWHPVYYVLADLGMCKRQVIGFTDSNKF